MRRSGLSLVEVLITMTLLVMLTGAIVSIFLAVRPVYAQNEGMAESHSWSRLPLARMGRILDTALSPGRGSAISHPDEGQTDTHLDFYSCDPTLWPPGNFNPRAPQFYRYRLEQADQRLRLVWLDAAGNPTARTAVLGHDLANVTFTNLNDKSVQVDLTTVSGYMAADHSWKQQRVRAVTILAVPNGE